MPIVRAISILKKRLSCYCFYTLHNQDKYLSSDKTNLQKKPPYKIFTYCYLCSSVFYTIINNIFLNFICHICHHHGFLIEIQRVICVTNNYYLQYLPLFCHKMWQKRQNMPHKTVLFRKNRLKNSSFDHQNSASCAKIVLMGAK